MHGDAIDMTCRLVGFLKQAKNRVSDWSLWAKAIACLFPHLCRLLEKSVRLIRAENKRTQLCLQTELAEKKSLLSQKLQRWAQQIYVTKEKILTPNAIKKFCMQARNILTNLSASPARSEKPGLIYNSAPRQKFHPKSSTVLA